MRPIVQRSLVGEHWGCRRPKQPKLEALIIKTQWAYPDAPDKVGRLAPARRPVPIGVSQGRGEAPRYALGDWPVQRCTARLKALSSEYPKRSAISERGKWRCFM
jgi:hypothetical protein